MTDVSIIIPTYNRLWSLPKAIDSCKDTLLNIEIIVIDDGSTDGTAEWLAQQPKLTVITQYNQGKDWAVNAGMAIAKGKYIRFLDSDDWLLPRSTDELFAHAEKHKLDITCAGYQVFDEEKLIRQIEWTVCDDFLAQQLGECDSSHYSAYLFKRDFIKDVPHRQEYGSRDDRKFIIEAALKNPVTGYISTPTLAHRHHKNNRLQTSAGLDNLVNNRALLTIYKTTFAVLEKENRLSPRYKHAAANQLWHLAHWIAKADINEAKAIYQWVYELCPGYTPGSNRKLALLYKTLGFGLTERMLRGMRIFKTPAEK
jgi:glycosyltransferase involved in cell wall biosynthesis